MRWGGRQSSHFYTEEGTLITFLVRGMVSDKSPAALGVDI